MRTAANAIAKLRENAALEVKITGRIERVLYALLALQIIKIVVLFSAMRLP